MRCLLVLARLVVFVVALPCAAQSSGSAPSVAAQNQSATPTPSQAPSPATAASADAKKPKKIWTNENMSDANGAISVVGDSPNTSKYKLTLDMRADPQLVADMRNDLEKFQSQMDDTNKQLAGCEKFQQGEAVSTNARQINKGVSRVPVDQQILALQEKKKQIQTKMDALLDAARQNGVLPGQLR